MTEGQVIISTIYIPIPLWRVSLTQSKEIERILKGMYKSWHLLVTILMSLLISMNVFSEIILRIEIIYLSYCPYPLGFIGFTLFLLLAEPF